MCCGANELVGGFQASTRPPSLLICIEKWGRGSRRRSSVVAVSFVLADPAGAHIEEGKNDGDR